MWFEPFEQYEREWNDSAKKAALVHPLNVVTHPPKMVGITLETAKWLRFKSLKWVISQDLQKKLLKMFFKHPFKYGFCYLKSILHKKSYVRDGDLFLYGISSVNEFEKRCEDKNTLLVLGFSYCHKPLECPSGRFSDQCCASTTNTFCKQCFIGKMCQATAKENTVILFIPTINYVGEKIFDLVQTYPSKKILFLITACEMALTMFADFGNMIDICGIGVRLEGRICNTLKAFALSEQGIKPGITSVSPKSQQRMLQLIRKRNAHYET